MSTDKIKRYRMIAVWRDEHPHLRDTDIKYCDNPILEVRMGGCRIGYGPNYKGVHVVVIKVESDEKGRIYIDDEGYVFISESSKEDLPEGRRVRIDEVRCWADVAYRHKENKS